VDDFVVVSSRAAAAVVEVKSCMEQQEFNEIMEVWKGACQLNVPVLGFAYDGVTFGTFLEYVDAQMRIPHRGPTVQAPPSIRFLPECIAVHSRNYVGFRCQDLEGRYRARRYFALSFGEAPAAALAFFFRLYALWLGEPGSAAEGKLLYEFNTMPDIIDKRWLAPGGEWQRGPAPED
jgi:hypothetical protein